jgi:Icc-related predicted phosphoesterase
MRAARNAVNDHRLIGWRKEPWERFRPEEALMLHATSRAFLADTLATPFDGSATVVLTHHAPHVNSVPNRFADDILSAAFASAVLGDLVEAGPDRDQCTTIPVRANSGTIDLWIHGHIHDSSDYRVGDTRVIANPHGYGAENPNFDPALVVEIGT